MDFHNFPPLTTSLQRGRRTKHPLEDCTLQYLLTDGRFSFSDLFLNDITPSTRFPRMSTEQASGRPAFHAQGLSTNPCIARGADCVPFRLRSREGSPLNAFGTSGPRYSFPDQQPERIPGCLGARFMDVVDEDQLTWIGVEPSSRCRGSGMSNEELQSLWDFPEHERERPERPRVTISPSPGRYHFGDPRQERGFRASIPRASPFRQSPPKPTQDVVCLPFGKALRWLYGALADAEKFFRTFQDAYNKEVKAIDRYASTEILQHLWVHKVMGRGAPDEGGQDKKYEKWEDKFAEKRRSLREAMEAALNASLSLGEQKTLKSATVESRKRLQEKVLTAGNHVMNLLDLVVKESEHCKALRGELKLLKDLVDPKKNENQALYDGVESEGSVGKDDGRGGGYDNEQPTLWDDQQ